MCALYRHEDPGGVGRLCVWGGLRAGGFPPAGGVQGWMAVSAGAVPSATLGRCHTGRLTEAGHWLFNREQNMVSVYYQGR